MRKERWLSTVVALATVLGGIPVQAATPSGATIDGSRPVNWSFAAVEGALSGHRSSLTQQNTCAAGVTCDTFDLKVAVPTTGSSFYATRFTRLAMTFTWDAGSGSILDFYANAPDGTLYQAQATDTPGQDVMVLVNAAAGDWTITVTANQAPTPTISHAQAVLRTERLAVPRPSAYQTYLLPYRPGTVGGLPGEPSIGVDVATGAVMYQANTETERGIFDDSARPAKVTWTDVSGPVTGTFTGDPILFTDRRTHRTFVSQDVLACSLMAYTDDDGATWTPSEGCDLPAAVDHPSVGGGPMPPGFPLPTVGGYPDAVYYCSQNVVEVQCGMSIDGGLTFLSDAPAWNEETSGPAGSPGCDGLHGHIKVGPDGVAYVPLHNCGSSLIDLTCATSQKDPTAVANCVPGFDGHRGLAVSHDGVTWHVSLVPDSTVVTNFGDTDPSVATDAANTLYYGYQNRDGTPRVAVSHDDGQTFSPSVAVGGAFGIRNTEFAEMVAGDSGRAAMAFLGTTTAGDDQQASFPGLWDLYVATTLDGGRTWSTVNATPGNPVQRGCIWNQGGSNQCRNLLDFNDATIDGSGRILVAYTKGCSQACAADPEANTYDSVAALARQSCGIGLIARYDPGFGRCPGAAPPPQQPRVRTAERWSVRW